MEIPALLPTRRQRKVLDVDHAIDLYLFRGPDLGHRCLACLRRHVLGMCPGEARGCQGTLPAAVVDLPCHLLQIPPGLHRLVRIQPGLAQGCAIGKQHRQRKRQRQCLDAAAGIIHGIGDLGIKRCRVELLPGLAHHLMQGTKARPGAEELHAVIWVEQGKVRQHMLVFLSPRILQQDPALALLFVVETQAQGRQRVQCLAFEVMAQRDVLRQSLERRHTSEQYQHHLVHASASVSFEDGKFIRDRRRARHAPTPGHEKRFC